SPACSDVAAISTSCGKRCLAPAHQPAHSSNPKPISFGICSRFVSAPSNLKSDANLFRLATSVLLMGLI
ncbi:hypothetical protein ACNS0K_003966, partial [Cronobacter sakazakii]